ncbi:hypothetical protein IPU75_19950 [Ochrobactrum sp. SD129]|nr:hypothetical protein [Ochrobactrum sp. SD129]
MKIKTSIASILFVVIVVSPTALIGIYYALISSNQYRSESLFAVRGTTTSPLSALGLSALPGANLQSGDSYIVADYIRSKQIIYDAIKELGVDMRIFYSGDNVDLYYRIDRNIPIDKFLSYWNHMSEVEFNSITGITTFRVKAFSPEDSLTISKAIIKVSEQLVNRLSANARTQLIATAQEEVSRTEERLANARQNVEIFRNEQQALDPQLLAQSEQSIIKDLQVSLAELQARRNALLQSTKASPMLRVIERQIGAIEQQIQDQKQRVGSGKDKIVKDASNINLSKLYTNYGALLLEQEFAEKAHTAAQTALEQALTEARKQDRYFAIVVEPNLPDASLYPRSIMNTLLVFAALLILWLLAYLFVQSVKDHAI